MYHFAQLRQEIGDLQLIGLMALRLQSSTQISATLAVRAAADQFEILAQLQQGEPVFSQIRDNKSLVVGCTVQTINPFQPEEDA